jgi:hypothetical protein
VRSNPGPVVLLCDEIYSFRSLIARLPDPISTLISLGQEL